MSLCQRSEKTFRKRVVDNALASAISSSCLFERCVDITPLRPPPASKALLGARVVGAHETQAANTARVTVINFEPYMMMAKDMIVIGRV